VIVLAVDPGITTGWALVSDKGTIIGVGDLSEMDLGDALDALIRLTHSHNQHVEAIVERIPHTGGNGQLSLRLEIVRRTVERVLETYEVRTTHVLPASWKTSRTARTFKLPQGYEDYWHGAPELSPHMRDAIVMAFYYLRPGPMLRAAKKGRSQ
jgi:hypothetical protein